MPLAVEDVWFSSAVTTRTCGSDSHPGAPVPAVGAALGDELLTAERK